MLYASHVAAMAPASNLGAATPVAIGLGGARPDHSPSKGASGASSAPESSGDTMTAKQISDAVAYIRSLAQLRGRNAEWAERAVREAVSLPAARR
jgi:membrane-bound serine protease (ClpP class)